ncbi:MAG: SUMF1/EgtB/PvdO family nonheme iron enzyme [Rhodopirellula sp.]|nr:SUMF1/EgtB/PvdO family nonheme iron enzyme [Rhodopirellula sp.]
MSGKPKVFISYRRDDSGYVAQAIYDKLAQHLGVESVVFDVDTIPLGIDFGEFLNAQVSQSDAMLAIIGDQWLDIRGADGKRRLENPGDFVRIEIQAALKQGVPIIPVLVGRATIPIRTDLPRGLKALARRNAAEVRLGRDFHSHLALLVKGLDRVLANEATRDQPDTLLPPPLEDTITNSIGMKLKHIPAGEFMMGSPDSDAFYDKREKPQHHVRITKSFYLGVYPVTQHEYELIMQQNPSEFKGDPQRPVERVSWDDATEFCRKLSEQENKCWRLPTEAEWEYACRAGTTTRWYCGDEEKDVGRVAWYKANSGDTTHPVCEKEPNAWGLHDILGNVCEWCQDWQGGYGPDAVTDPVGPSKDGGRVLRGGSWAYPVTSCSAPARSGTTQGNRINAVGFRLVTVPPSYDRRGD